MAKFVHEQELMPLLFVLRIWHLEFVAKDMPFVLLFREKRIKINFRIAGFPTQRYNNNQRKSIHSLSSIINNLLLEIFLVNLSIN